MQAGEWNLDEAILISEGDRLGKKTWRWWARARCLTERVLPQAVRRERIYDFALTDELSRRLRTVS